jgi:hypothetical protein
MVDMTRIENTRKWTLALALGLGCVATSAQAQHEELFLDSSLGLAKHITSLLQLRNELAKLAGPGVTLNSEWSITRPKQAGLPGNLVWSNELPFSQASRFSLGGFELGYYTAAVEFRGKPTRALAMTSAGAPWQGSFASVVRDLAAAAKLAKDNRFDETKSRLMMSYALRLRQAGITKDVDHGLGLFAKALGGVRLSRVSDGTELDAWTPLDHDPDTWSLWSNSKVVHKNAVEAALQQLQRPADDGHSRASLPSGPSLLTGGLGTELAGAAPTGILGIPSGSQPTPPASFPTPAPSSGGSSAGGDLLASIVRVAQQALASQAYEGSGGDLPIDFGGAKAYRQ